MSYHFNENASYSHMFAPNWLASAQNLHTNVVNGSKNISNSQQHDNPTTSWLQNVTEKQVNAMNLHRAQAQLQENTNSLDSNTNSQDTASSWPPPASNGQIDFHKATSFTLDPIDLHKATSFVKTPGDTEKEARPKPPRVRKSKPAGLPKRRPLQFLPGEDPKFTCDMCKYRCLKEAELRKHVYRIHHKEKNIICSWENCDFRTAEKAYLKRHIDGVHLKSKQFTCPRPDCQFKTDRKATLEVHMKCEPVHMSVKPKRKSPTKPMGWVSKAKIKDDRPKRKYIRKEGVPSRKGRKRGRPKKKKPETSSDDDEDNITIDPSDLVPYSPPAQTPDEMYDEKPITKLLKPLTPKQLRMKWEAYNAKKAGNYNPDEADSDSDLEKPLRPRKNRYIRRPKNGPKKSTHTPKVIYPPGTGFYCEYLNCNYQTLKEADLRKHVHRIHLKPKDQVCLVPGCTFSSSEKLYLKRHIDGVHLKVKNFKCSWEDCNFRTDRNGTLKEHVKVMHLEERPFPCQFCDKTFKTEFIRDSHHNVHFRELKKKKIIVKCDQCVLDFRSRSAYRRHLLKAHSKRLAYKCRLCRYSSNVKSHLARHISDRHLRIKPFACAFCPYSCAQAGNLRSHLKRVHPEEREALEALARPEREKPFPCNHCDYRATQSGNLRTHMKNKHPAEYLAREESRIRRQAERREERALNRLLLPKKKYPKKEYPRRGRRMRGRRGRPKRKEVESSEDEDKSSEDEDKEKIEPEDDMGDEIPENGDEGLEEGDLMEGVVGDMLPEDVCHEDGDILPEEENLTGLETMPMMMEPDVDFMVDAEDIPEEREIKYVPVSVPEQAPVIQHELKYVPDQHQITLQAVQQPDQVVQQQVVIQQRELKYSAATPEQLQQVQQVTIQQQNQLQQHHELKYITTQHTSQQQPEQKFVPQQVTQQVTQVVTQHDTIPTTTQTPPIAHEAPGLVPIRGVAGYQFPASFSHHMPYL